ncbi:MAG: hypothetical protein ACRC35_13560 [Angustibacter sp.]
MPVEALSVCYQGGFRGRWRMERRPKAAFGELEPAQGKSPEDLEVTMFFSRKSVVSSLFSVAVATTAFLGFQVDSAMAETQWKNVMAETQWRTTAVTSSMT